MTQDQINAAYYTGKNSVWQEHGPVCPFSDKELANSWKRGRRHARSEERLSDDTEWDD